jgi:hypothetical protein
MHDAWCLKHGTHKKHLLVTKVVPMFTVRTSYPQKKEKKKKPN